MGCRKRIALAAAVLALAVSAAAAERSRRFTTIDFPESVATTAFGVNERDEIVGRYRDSSNRTHGISPGSTSMTTTGREKNEAPE
jgi:hypothetical protein